MTSIIVDQCCNNTHFITHFYLSRARRIIPALFVLCVALLVLGWCYLLPIDYKYTAQGTLSSITLVSNIVYWHQSGYFDLASHEKLLLHTWSLSVEWQFYLLYPIMLSAVLRFLPGISAVRSILAIVFGISLIVSIASIQWAPSASFYTLPPRVWEFMIGGLIYVCRLDLDKLRRWLPALELFGLLAIILPILLFSPTTEWPGYLAAVPTTGCALIILANRKQSFWSSNPVSHILGKLSYSLYLWHWPVLVVLKYFLVRSDLVTSIAGIATSLVLGAISFRFAETAMRNAIAKLSAAQQVCVFGAMVGAVSLASVVVLTNDGFASRSMPETRALAAEAARAGDGCWLYQNPIDEVTGCHIGLETAPETVFLIGDSHAISLFGVVDDVLRSTGRGGRFFSAISCAPIFGMSFSKIKESDCIGFYRILRSKPFSGSNTQIVLAGRWSSYVYGRNEDGMRAAIDIDGVNDFESLPLHERESILSDRITRGICQFSRLGRIFVVGQIPEMNYNIPLTIAREMRLFGSATRKHFLSRDEYERRNAVINGALLRATRECDATILNPAEYLCDSDSCYGERGGHAIYNDSNHLNEYGNRILIPMFDPLFSATPNRAR